MPAELLENSIESIQKGKQPDSLSSQFLPPYKWYNPKFDFYSANGMYLDDKGNWTSPKKDANSKLARQELQNRLHTEVSNLITFWEETIFPVWIQAIKDYQMCTLDRGLMLKAQGKDFLTNEKQPIIRTYTDRVVSTVFRGGFSFNIYPQNETKVKKSAKAKHFSERCFGTAKMRKTLLDAATDAVLMGNAYYKIGFVPSREKAKEDVSDKDTVYNISEVYATSEYVSPFNIFYEPQRDFYKQSVVYRNFFPLRQILQDKKDFFRLDKDQIAIILGSPMAISDKNFNKVKLIKYYQQYLIKNNIAVTENDLYKVQLNDDLVEYVERWSDNNLVIAVNGYIVYDYKNPLPTRKHPFKRISYTRVPGIDIGDGVGTILAGPQKLYDAMFNIMFDLAKFSAGPMFLLKPGQAIEGMGATLNYEPFTFRQLRGAADATIETFQLPGPKDVNFAMMNDILNMANNAIAPTTYNELQGVSRSATDAEFRNESLRDAIMPLAESMNEAISDSLKDYFLLAKHNMPNKFKISVLGQDGKQVFDTVSLADLKGNFTFEIEFESIKDVNKTVERAQWNNLLAQLPAIAQDPVRKKYLLDMEKIASHIMSLYSPNNEGFILSDEDFYRLSEQGEMALMTMQKQLQDFQNQLQGPAGSVEPGVGEQLDPQMVAQQQPVEQSEAVGSEIAADTSATLDVASILKQVRE